MYGRKLRQSNVQIKKKNAGDTFLCSRIFPALQCPNVLLLSSRTLGIYGGFLIVRNIYVYFITVKIRTDTEKVSGILKIKLRCRGRSVHFPDNLTYRKD